MPIYTLKPQAELRLPARAEFEAPENVWPLPSLVYDALHAALHRAFPQVQLWEQTHAFGRSGRYASQKEKGERFGSLTLAGPFPCRDHAPRLDWFFPRPADVIRADEPDPPGRKSESSAEAGPGPGANSAAGRGGQQNRGEFSGLILSQPLKDDPGRGNLPAPLRHIVGNPCSINFPPVPAWWSKPALEAYLRGESPAAAGLVDSGQLYAWDLEAVRRTGSRAEPDEFSARGSLRLADNVFLGLHASMPLSSRGNQEGLDLLITNEDWPLVVGGGQRVSRLRKLETRQSLGGQAEKTGLEHFLPLSAAPSGQHVKWVLLSPALFPALKAGTDGAIRNHPGGWLPNWICPETGRVVLKQGRAERQPGESRIDWRQRWRRLPDMDCRLVAALIPKPLILGGWSSRLRGEDPAQIHAGLKALCLAVPAGAVFFFAGPDAPALSELLSWHGSQRENLRSIIHRRSAVFGEKGFGLGVCGPWDYLDL